LRSRSNWGTSLPSYKVGDTLIVTPPEEIKESVLIDVVNHPAHYKSHPSGIEVIEITKWMSFTLGNTIKYIMRADHKGKRLEDLKKARWYLDLEIQMEEQRDPKRVQ
jgi:Protein of unknwon function (DUF3310)